MTNPNGEIDDATVAAVLDRYRHAPPGKRTAKGTEMTISLVDAVAWHHNIVSNRRLAIKEAIEALQHGYGDQAALDAELAKIDEDLSASKQLWAALFPELG